jgi:hypothetical protein
VFSGRFSRWRITLEAADSFLHVAQIAAQQPSTLLMSNDEHHPVFVMLMLKLLEEQALSMIR